MIEKKELFYKPDYGFNINKGDCGNLDCLNGESSGIKIKEEMGVIELKLGNDIYIVKSLDELIEVLKDDGCDLELLIKKGDKFKTNKIKL